MAVISAIPLSCSSMMQGTTIYVDCNNIQGPWDGSEDHPYRFIVDGVGHAENGDAVCVLAGLYVEHVIIEKAIRLYGEGSNKTCVGVVDKNSTCFTILASDARIDNLTFVGDGYYIPAVRFLSADRNNFTDNVIQNFSIGISIEHSYHNFILRNILSNISRTGMSLTDAFDNVIYENYIDVYASGIELIESDSNDIFYNILQGHRNTVSTSYGVYFLTSNHNRFGYNVLNQHNIGVMLDYISYLNYIVHNDFYGNFIGGTFAYNSFLNYWNGNYWNRPHILPRPIFGWIYNVPVVKFDWHPASTPNI